MCCQVKVKIQFLLGGPINPKSLKEKACHGPFGLAHEPLQGSLNHWWMGSPGPVLH